MHSDDGSSNVYSVTSDSGGGGMNMHLRDEKEMVHRDVLSTRGIRHF